MQENNGQDIFFTGDMDLDHDHKSIKPGDYFYASNFRNKFTENGIDGSGENISSNVQVAYTLPAGTNKCIGRLEDVPNNRIYYWVWNNLSNHSILRYTTQTTGNGLIEKVYQGSILNFGEWDYINGANVIGNILYWNDGRNPQRKINLDKAVNTNKNIQAKLCIGKPRRSFSFNLAYARTGFGASINLSYVPTDPDNLSLSEALDQFKAQMNADVIFSSFFEPTIISRQYIELVSATTDIWTLTISGISQPSESAWIVPINWYPTVTQKVLDVCGWPSWGNPTTLTFNDTTRVQNTLSGSGYQFALKYYYTDLEESSISPYSGLALYAAQPGTDLLNPDANAIRIMYSDNGRLFDDRCIIRGVEIFVRTSNTDSFRSVVYLSDYELTGWYIFYNDGQYTAIGENEQARPYMNIPILSGTQDVAEKKLFYGDNTFGYPNEPIDINIDTIWSAGAQALYDISGSIVVKDIYTDEIKVFGTGPTADKIDEWKVPAGGFFVYLAGTKYATLTVQDGTSQNFTIPQVPNGRYILRIASHSVKYPNTDGEKYTYSDSNLAWQNTSTFVRGFTPDGGSFLPAIREAVVTVNNGNVTVGEFTVDYLFEQPFHNDSFWMPIIFAGYVMDNNHNAVADPRPGFTVEYTAVLLHGTYNSTFGTITVFEWAYSDHNGFFYLKLANSFIPLDFGFLSGNTLIAEATGKNYTVGGGAFTSVMRYGNPSPDSLDYQTASFAGIIIYILWTQRDDDYQVTAFLPNFNASLTANYRTQVLGKIVDDNLVGVPNVCLAIEKCGRTAITNTSGEFAITIYAKEDVAGVVRRLGDSLTLGNNNRFATIQFVVGGVALIITPLAASGTPHYNNTSPYRTGDLNTTIVPNPWSFAKSGGKYSLALIYFDRINRDNTCNVVSQSSISIPFYTEGVEFQKYPSIRTAIHHRPPSWATHYCWARTRNLAYNTYLQIPIDSVQYVSSINPDGSRVESSYGSSDVKYLFVNIGKTLLYYKNDYAGAVLEYEYAPGDRVKFIKKADGSYYDQYVDAEILGQDGDAVQIKYRPEYPELIYGAILEFYSPRKTAERFLYYEFGEFYDIGNPALATRYHKGKDQNQSPTDPITVPALSTLSNMDTYLRRRRYTVRDVSHANILKVIDVIVETDLLSDFNIIIFSGIGRANAVIPTNKQVRRIGNLCFSNVYELGSQLNGFGTYELLNNDDIATGVGPLRKICTADNVLLCVCENKSFSIYVDKGIIQGQDGSPTISLSQKVIGAIRDLNGTYGTINPESFAYNDGLWFWWDAYRGVVCQYSLNGIDEVSKYKAVNYFSNQGVLGIRANRQTYKVVAAIHRWFDEYIMAFPAITVDSILYPAETIVFNYIDNGWKTFFPFHPEMMCSIGVNLVTFNSGNFWLHKENSSKNEFYGVRYPTEIGFVVNVEGKVQKTFQSVSMESSAAPNFPKITTPPDEWNLNGQESELLTTDFEYENGSYWAAFLKNKLTPNFDTQDALNNGEELQAQIIDMMLSKDTAVLFWIKSAKIYFDENELTNS